LLIRYKIAVIVALLVCLGMCLSSSSLLLLMASQ
jgi:hypothetical protein